MLISKIVSGGQTGVDRGALVAALDLGFPYGGYVPKGRRAEDGIVPLEFSAMTEDTRKDYRQRSGRGSTRRWTRSTPVTARERYSPPPRASARARVR